jgi:hypothetical protein
VHASHVARWLILVQQLPTRPSNLRVHVWRRLQQVGAVSLRNSIYVLPNTTEAREDFDWIRAEIAGRGGQVSLLVANAVDGYTDDELEGAFRDARTADYDKLIAHAASLSKDITAKTLRQRRAPLQRELVKARERFLTLRGIDFFGSPRAADAQSALERLEGALVQSPAAQQKGSALDVRQFRGRVWLTRPRPGIDRMSSAWLIRRFVSPEATFRFGPLASAREAIPFDMPDVEFGHHGSDCTYETLMRRFGIEDPAAVHIGQMVHDLDLKETRFDHRDTATIGRLVEGLRERGTEDARLLEDGITLMDALYCSLRQAEREPSKPNPRTGSRAGKRGRRPTAGRER